MKKLVIMILALVLTLGGCTTPKTEEPSEDIVNVETGDTGNTDETAEPETIEAPDFTLKNLDGEEITLSDLRGKIVLINFWASWCTWCDKEMPDLQRIHEENEDLVVLAVDVMETEAEVRKYLEEGNYTFEAVLDTDGEVSGNYLVSGLPTSYFVGTDGALIGRVPRAMAYDEINEILDMIRELEKESEKK